MEEAAPAASEWRSVQPWLRTTEPPYPPLRQSSKQREPAPCSATKSKKSSLCQATAVSHLSASAACPSAQERCLARSPLRRRLRLMKSWPSCEQTAPPAQVQSDLMEAGSSQEARKILTGPRDAEGSVAQPTSERRELAAII